LYTRARIPPASPAASPTNAPPYATTLTAENARMSAPMTVWSLGRAQSMKARTVSAAPAARPTITAIRKKVGEKPQTGWYVQIVPDGVGLQWRYACRAALNTKAE